MFDSLDVFFTRMFIYLIECLTNGPHAFPRTFRTLNSLEHPLRDLLPARTSSKWSAYLVLLITSKSKVKYCYTASRYNKGLDSRITNGCLFFCSLRKEQTDQAVSRRLAEREREYCAFSSGRLENEEPCSACCMFVQYLDPGVPLIH